MAKLTILSASRPLSGVVFRTRVIVRLGTQNRMVTKGYRKGVYNRVIAAEQRQTAENRFSDLNRLRAPCNPEHGWLGLTRVRLPCFCRLARGIQEVK